MYESTAHRRRALDPRTWNRFARVMVAIIALAFAVRVAYVAFAKLDENPAIGDQLYYNAAANRLGNGDGFLEPFDPQALQEGVITAGDDPAADHPPLTIVVLAPVSLLTDESPNAHRFTMVLLGTVGVLVIGLLAREIAGDRAGWMAGGVAALYPNLWVNDGLIMSETLAALLVALVLLFAYRLRSRPDVRTAVLLGVWCGLAALTRAELLLLFPLLTLPTVLRARTLPMAARWRLATASAGMVAVLVVPWVAFNLVRFEEPTLLSTNDGIALLGSNCDSVYSDAGTGLTDLGCLGPNPVGDQSQDSKRYRNRAFDYIREHRDRAVVVAAARVGRTWSVFRPWDMVSYNEGEARERWVTALGILAFYPLLTLALGGAMILRRRPVALWPLLVPAVIVTIASAATYGQTRFRVPAEPSLVVLAAVALGALVTRISQSRTSEASSPQ